MFSDQKSFEILHQAHLQESEILFKDYKRAKAQVGRERLALMMQNQASLLKMTADRLVEITFAEHQLDRGESDE